MVILELGKQKVSDLSKVIHVVKDTDGVASQAVRQQSLHTPRVMGIFLEMDCVFYVRRQHLLFIAGVKIHPSLSLFPQNLSPCFCLRTAHTRGTLPGCFRLKELSPASRHRQQSSELPCGLWLRHIFPGYYTLHKQPVNLPAFSNTLVSVHISKAVISSQPRTWETCEWLTL